MLDTKTAEPTPATEYVKSKKDAEHYLDFYFNDGWTIDDFRNNLLKFVSMAKESPKWNDEMNEEVETLDVIITSAGLITKT